MSNKRLIASLSLIAATSLDIAFLNTSKVEALGVEELAGKHIQQYVTDDMLMNADKEPNNWIHYGRDYEGTRFSPLKQINQDNVTNLVPKWNLSFGVIGAQDSQVMAVNGRLYVTSSHNRVWALEGKIGEVLWKYVRSLPGDLGPKLCCGSVNRGVAVYKNMLFMATLDTHMITLNNATGEVMWEKKLGDYKTGEIFTSMPMVVDGKVLIGNSGGDLGANPGTVYALDAETGKLVWKTYTVPVTGKEDIAKTWGKGSWKTAGGTPWLPPTYDKETGLVLYRMLATQYQTSMAMYVQVITFTQVKLLVLTLKQVKSKGISNIHQMMFGISTEQMKPSF